MTNKELYSTLKRVQNSNPWYGHKHENRDSK